MRRSLVSFFARNRLGKNSVLATLQALVTMVCMFFAYRLLVQTVGLEQTGLWSLLLAGAAIGQLANMTGSASLSRFVAESRAEGRDAGIYVHTVTLSTLAIYAFIGGTAYIFVEDIVRYFAEGDLAEDALGLAPYAICSGLIMGALSVTISSAIDGLHRADLRAQLTIFSQIVFVTVVYLFVPDMGLLAWAGAILLQQGIVIVLGWGVLAYFIKGLGALPYRWNRAIFVETISFGVKVQLLNIISILSEPLAKAMLAQFGNLASVALYELAMRLVMAGRNLIAQAATPLVPEFAASSRDSQKIQSILKESRFWILLATIAVAGATFAVSPLYSLFMLGSIETDFVLYICALALGSALNTIALPYFMAGLGCNIMFWNVTSQVAMALSVILLGSLAGSFFSVAGVVAAIAAGMALSGVVIILGNRYALLQKREEYTQDNVSDE